MSVNKLPEFNPNDLGFDVYMNLVDANFVAYSITEETKKKNLFLVSIGTKNFGILANLAAKQSLMQKWHSAANFHFKYSLFFKRRALACFGYGGPIVFFVVIG